MRNWIDILKSETPKAQVVVEWKALFGHELRPLVWGPKGKSFDLPFLKGSDFADEFHLTAWADGKLVGDAELKQSPYNPDEMWLMHVAVDPDFQGRGYGKVMVSWGFKTAMVLGKKSMTLSSFTDQGQERLGEFARETAERYASNIDTHFNSDGPRRAIKEEFALHMVNNETWRANPTECVVFKNPTRKEWAEATAKCSDHVRAWVRGDDVYVWDAYSTNHNSVKEKLGFDNQCIPLYIYGAYRKEASLVVTDSSESTIWYHNPSVQEALWDCAGLKRMFTDMEIGYFDEAIVGPWDEHTAAQDDEDDEEEQPWDPHTDYHDDDYENRLEEAYGDNVVKFWISSDGKTHMLEPGIHHIDAIDDLGSDWFSSFRTGWVRGFFETRSDTMNYSFMEKKVTSAAIKEMLRMAREWKATGFHIEEADDRNPASTDLSPREFTQYIRSKSVAPSPLLETKHEGFQTWSTITDSYQGESFGYCQAEDDDKGAIGYINFSIYQGRAHVKMIEVSDDWRRKGVATALMKELAEMVGGDDKIDWGEHTEDGSAFHKAYDTTPLTEGFKGDDEGLCLKGWYDFRSKKWVDVPYGWHHSGIVWNNPETFRWDTVFKFSAAEYCDRFERASRHPPKWDDGIIDSMVEADWGRIGMMAESQRVYVNARTLKQCQELLRFYVKQVCPADDISHVYMSNVDENSIEGTVASVLRQ